MKKAEYIRSKERQEKKRDNQATKHSERKEKEGTLVLNQPYVKMKVRGRE